MNIPRELLEKPIAYFEEFGLPVRTINELERCLGAIFLHDLGMLTRKEFLDTGGMGVETLRGLELAIINAMEKWNEEKEAEKEARKVNA